MNIPEIRSYEDEAVNIVVSVLNKAQEKLGVRQNLFQIAPFEEESLSESPSDTDSVETIIEAIGESLNNSFQESLKDTIEEIIKEAIRKTNLDPIEDNVKDTLEKTSKRTIEGENEDIENTLEETVEDIKDATLKKGIEDTSKVTQEETFEESGSQAGTDCVDLVAHSAKLSLSTLGPPLAINSEKFLIDAIERKWRLTDALMYVLKYQGSSQDESSQYYYFEALFSQPNVRYPVPQATVSVFFRIEDKLIEPRGINPIPVVTFRIEGQHTDHDVRHVLLTVDWLLAVIQMKIKLFKRIEQIRIF